MRSGQKEKEKSISFDSIDEDNNFSLNKSGEIYQKPLFITCSTGEYENILQYNKQVSCPVFSALPPNDGEEKNGLIIGFTSLLNKNGLTEEDLHFWTLLGSQNTPVQLHTEGLRWED